MTAPVDPLLPTCNRAGGVQCQSPPALELPCPQPPSKTSSAEKLSTKVMFFICIPIVHVVDHNLTASASHLNRECTNPLKNTEKRELSGASHSVLLHWVTSQRTDQADRKRLPNDLCGCSIESLSRSELHCRVPGIQAH